jgi:hypothetical protein
MKRKLISPPIHGNGGYSPLLNIEGLVELEPENGCFVSSRIRDESRIMKSHLRHPLNYVSRQISPWIKSNNKGKKIVQTYLFARKYLKLKDHIALAKILCGQEQIIPESSKIWFEAYLQPTRQG